MKRAGPYPAVPALYRGYPLLTLQPLPALFAIGRILRIGRTASMAAHRLLNPADLIAQLIKPGIQLIRPADPVLDLRRTILARLLFIV